MRGLLPCEELAYYNSSGFSKSMKIEDGFTANAIEIGLAIPTSTGSATAEVAEARRQPALSWMPLLSVPVSSSDLLNFSPDRPDSLQLK
jgi:hypothetical protein